MVLVYALLFLAYVHLNLYLTSISYPLKLNLQQSIMISLHPCQPYYFNRLRQLIQVQQVVCHHLSQKMDLKEFQHLT